jgi:hypothetical protein
MPLIKLQFRPGVNRDQTDYSAEGGWYECDKIRFRSGFPEKIGGWTKASPVAFYGVCRQMWNWITSYQDNFLALGTDSKVYIELPTGSMYDITPLRPSNPVLDTPDTDDCVYTTIGSNVVVLDLGTAHGASTGDFVTVSGVEDVPVGSFFTNGSPLIVSSDAPEIGTPVRFATNGTLPTNFDTNTTYFVIQRPNQNIIAVSTTPDVFSTPVVAGSAGSGNHTLVGTLGGIPINPNDATGKNGINNNHRVTAINSTALSFVVNSEATSTRSGVGGTNIELEFEISVGSALQSLGYGWGTGPWGGYDPLTPTVPATGWGEGSSTPLPIGQRDWWFDNIDNDLVMNIRNGVPYYWERGTLSSPTVALGTRAITLAQFATNEGFDSTKVPVKVMQLMVAQQGGFLIAFGAVPYGSTTADDFDPMLIRWAAFDNPADWTISSLTPNGAGFTRVSRGSRIVRALATRQEILVWTDTNLYTMQFTGTVDVFQLQEYADNISIISPRAVANASGVTYWMGQDKFYSYSGVVNTLPCTLRNHVFMNINTDQLDQIVCGTNEQWNEIWWFYPTANSNYNNAYVVYNHLDRLWYYGSIDRTAWLDTPLRRYPQAANTVFDTEANEYVETSTLYNHEDGIDADGVAMESFIQSNDFDIEDGERFILSRRVLPDIGFAGSDFGNENTPAPEVTMELRYRNFPGSTLRTGVEDTARVITTSVDAYTTQVFIRARARQMALKIMSENLGVQWQLGTPRLDAREDGKR